MHRLPARLLCGILLAGTLAGAAQAAACRQTAGRAQAQTYVDQCLEVSPATHPPCNVDNPCDLITGEIARGCALLKGDDAPSFCAEYGDGDD